MKLSMITDFKMKRCYLFPGLGNKTNQKRGICEVYDLSRKLEKCLERTGGIWELFSRKSKWNENWAYWRLWTPEKEEKKEKKNDHKKDKKKQYASVLDSLEIHLSWRRRTWSSDFNGGVWRNRENLVFLWSIDSNDCGTSGRSRISEYHMKSWWDSNWLNSKRETKDTTWYILIYMSKIIFSRINNNSGVRRGTDWRRDSFSIRCHIPKRSFVFERIYSEKFSRKGLMYIWILLYQDKLAKIGIYLMRYFRYQIIGNSVEMSTNPRLLILFWLRELRLWEYVEAMKTWKETEKKNNH